MDKKSRQHLQQVLEKDPSCYVLITCGQPTEDGQMQVEMTYQGDVTLASYLLQSAQSYMEEEQDNLQILESDNVPPIRLVK